MYINPAIDLYKAILSQGGLGTRSVKELCEEVAKDTYDEPSDPISAIIINACTNEEVDGAVSNLEYAISQLKNALVYMKSLEG